VPIDFRSCLDAEMVVSMVRYLNITIHAANKIGYLNIIIYGLNLDNQ